MKPLFILILTCLSLVVAKAQDNSQGRNEPIRQLIDEDLPSNIIYRYPTFTSGLVYFRNNSVSSAKMNYNLLAQEMQFLDAKGDTMAIANEADISYITIGNDSFYLDKGVEEIIGTFNPVKLAVRTKLRAVDRQKIGAYGIPSSAGSISTYTSIQENNKMYGLKRNEQVLYQKEKTFFLLTGDNHFVPVNKNNVAKAFSSKGKKLDRYLETEQVDFRKEADIRKVLAYASTL